MQSRTGRARLGVALALTTAATAAVVVGQGAPASGAAGGRDLAEVRAATARFHDVAVATAEGYVPVSGCEELPGAGAMGIHYLNPGLAADGLVDPQRPEVLLYLPSDDGLRLVGVEWFVAEAASGGQRPSVLGRGFDGPMPGHSEGMPSHYDLHAWIWAHNPTGTWQAWNPALTCEGSA
jgi:hypothetical protein